MPSLDEHVSRSVATIASAEKPRVWWLDAARGIAVIAMVGYHLMWDLDAFLIYSMPHWAQYAQMLIAVSFLFISGYCIAAFGADVPRQLRRLWLLSLAAIGVTLVSAFVIPQGVITFGILHLIALCSFLLIFLRRHPSVLLMLAIALIVSLGFTRRFMLEGFVWRCIGFHQDWRYSTADYFPVVPWGASMFVGAAAGNWLPPRKSRQYRREILSMIGRQSLIIYLCHQPIILAILWFSSFGRRPF